MSSATVRSPLTVDHPGSASAPLLAVDQLCVNVPTERGPLRLVEQFDLTLAAGDRVALVGESGSGKTVTARAIMRLNHRLHVTGSIRLDGVDLLKLGEKEMTRIRGSRIGMVFQDPMDALNPLQTVGDQVAEPLILRGTSRKEALARAQAMLEELGVARAAERMKAYPHEFSGGMRQRVVLAMALIGEPDVLIADEPTTALDVRVQRQVLNLLDEVQQRRKFAVLLITHDLAVVAGFADRVVVMYAGRKVEEHPTERLFAAPAHPYASALLQALPRIDRPPVRLEPIPGAPPSPASRPPGCAFHPRCPQAVDLCREDVPPLLPTADGGMVACHLADTIPAESPLPEAR
ncbi:MAG: ABC transporter ATP-binding protein [Chloroflexi bacterium]|nr:ABC transporter ATP-binding protein [Chloroflexota bacterium]